LAFAGLGLDLCFFDPCLASGKASNDAGPKVSDEYLFNMVDAIDQGMAR
jgi:hypothetical protein